MDDLDRELKLVQLQRDRLALEREMASHGIGRTTKQITNTIGLALILPPFAGLLKPPVMRTSCLAAGPLSSVAQTSLG